MSWVGKQAGDLSLEGNRDDPSPAASAETMAMCSQWLAHLGAWGDVGFLSWLLTVPQTPKGPPKPVSSSDE